MSLYAFQRFRWRNTIVARIDSRRRQANAVREVYHGTVEARDIRSISIIL